MNLQLLEIAIFLIFLVALISFVNSLNLVYSQKVVLLLFASVFVGLLFIKIVTSI